MLNPEDGEWPEFTMDSQRFLSISATPKIVDDLGQYKVQL
jgi:hypothetical protein